MNNFFLTPLLSYENIFQLAKDIYKYPGRFYAAFEGKDIYEWIDEQDHDKYVKLIELRRKNYIPDVFLFKASYILNPYMELRYHGFLFEDYQDIGRIIKKFSPKMDVYIQDLIRFGLLEEYMLKQEDDKKRPELFARVKKALDMYATNHGRAYFHLGYALDPEKTFEYEGEIYTDPKEFLKTRLYIRNLFEFATDFLENYAFLTWLEVLGYSSVLDRYQSVIKVVEEKEHQSIVNAKVVGENQNSDLLALFYKELEAK